MIISASLGSDPSHVADWWFSGPDDWVWLYPEVPKKLKSLVEDGFNLLFVSNQSGNTAFFLNTASFLQWLPSYLFLGIEKTTTKAEDIMEKMSKMVIALDAPAEVGPVIESHAMLLEIYSNCSNDFVVKSIEAVLLQQLLFFQALMSTGENHFRKPATGGWDYYCDKILKSKVCDPSLDPPVTSHSSTSHSWLFPGRSRLQSVRRWRSGSPKGLQTWPKEGFLLQWPDVRAKHWNR